MKLSIITPAMRTHYWPRFLNSIQKSCTKFQYEIIFISPFDLPENLKSDNILYLKSFSTVPVCIQKGTLLATGDLICHAVDDSVFYENTLDLSIEYFLNKMKYDDAITLTYTENTNNMNIKEKWQIKNISEFTGLKCVNPEWTTFVQPMMYKSKFIEMGGLDCSFEYSNHPHHDLAFRMNTLGSNIEVVPFSVSYAFHMPGSTGDHEPIQSAQEGPDATRFKNKWSGNDCPKTLIDYNNYIEYDKVWERRFKKQYKSYEEMYSEMYSDRG